MSEEFGNDFISITDEEGNSFELEVIDTLELEGESYALFLPADMDEDDPDYGYIILQVVEENGEELFSDVESEEMLQKLYDLFMEKLFDDEDEE